MNQDYACAPIRCRWLFSTVTAAALLGGGAILLPGLGIAQTAAPNAVPSQTTSPAGVTQPGSEASPASSTPSSMLSEVVVTGTLVPGVAPVGTDLITVNEADIAATGASTAGQVLQNVAQIDTFGLLPPAAFNSPLGPGGYPPELRGLPTLVLVNGNRTAGLGILQTTTDPDFIPPALIKSVQIVPDGASALYGSDAIGGVINFITKQSFNGLDFDARYGGADEYHQGDINIAAGKTWSDASAYIAYSWSDNSDLLDRDRSYVQQISPQTGACAPGTVTEGGVNYAIPSLVPGTMSTCNEYNNSTLFPAQHKQTVYAGVTKDFSDTVKAGAQAFYEQSSAENFDDPNGNSEVGGATITSSNPYYEAVGPNDTGTQQISFSYAPVFSGIDSTQIDEEGISGFLTDDLGSSWQLRANSMFTRNHVVADSFTTNTTAQAAALAGTTTATALDPYDLAKTNPSVLQGILADDFGISTQQLWDNRLIAAGNLFKLPGGSVKLATGTELIWQNITTGVGVSPEGTHIYTDRKTYNRYVEAAFGQLLVPIVGDSNALPAISALTLSVAGRFDHYSDFGSTENPQLGLTWKPVSWTSVRASWGTSFNAPSPTDTAGAVDGRVQVLPFSPFLAPGASPLNFLRPTVLLAGGNPNLKPQLATTYSFGGDIYPPVIPGLALHVTYYNVDFSNEITEVPFYLPTLFQPAYAGAYILNPTEAQIVARADASGLAGIVTGAPSIASLYAPGAPTPYLFVDARRLNLSSVKQDGLDFDVDYHRPAPFGSWSIGAGGTYLLDQTTQPVAGLPFTNTAQYSILEAGGLTVGRLQLTATAGLTVGPVSSRLVYNYAGGYDIVPGSAGTQTRVGGFGVANLHLEYDFQGGGALEHLSMYANINNMLNTSPPFYDANPGYTNGGTLGRLIEIGVHKTF